MAQRRASRRAKKVDPRERVKQGQEKADNQKAIQAVVIAVVSVLLIFGIIAIAGSGDDEPVKKKDNRDGYGSSGLSDLRTQKPLEDSKVPQWLAAQFMIALGEDDPDKAGELIWWDKLFELIDQQNRIDASETYVSQEDAEKENRREKYLLKVFDPDYVDLVSEKLLEGLIDGTRVNTAWGTLDIGADWGNVSYQVKDDLTDEVLLEVLVRTQLLPGYDPVRDATDRKAWRIVGLRHESRIKVGKSGKRVIKRRSDFGEDFYKKPRVKKKRNTNLGPPEAVPQVVAWLDGTSDEMKSRVQGLVTKTIDDSDVRTADLAKYELMEIGKTAVPGILSSISTMNFKDDDTQITQVFQLVQVLQEITGQRFIFSPSTGNQGFGRSGMTKQTPEEREKAIRRWFGWWETSGASWIPGEAPADEEEDTWEIEGDDEEEDKS